MASNAEKEVRYCKKCGCELVSTNHRKLCDSCRRKRAGNIRRRAGEFAGGVFSVVVAAAAKGKFDGKE